MMITQSPFEWGISVSVSPVLPDEWSARLWLEIATRYDAFSETSKYVNWHDEITGESGSLVGYMRDGVYTVANISRSGYRIGQLIDREDATTLQALAAFRPSNSSEADRVRKIIQALAECGANYRRSYYPGEMFNPDDGSVWLPDSNVSDVQPFLPSPVYPHTSKLALPEIGNLIFPTNQNNPLSPSWSSPAASRDYWVVTDIVFRIDHYEYNWRAEPGWPEMADEERNYVSTTTSHWVNGSHFTPVWGGVQGVFPGVEVYDRGGVLLGYGRNVYNGQGRIIDFDSSEFQTYNWDFWSTRPFPFGFPVGGYEVKRDEPYVSGVYRYVLDLVYINIITTYLPPELWVGKFAPTQPSGILFPQLLGLGISLYGGGGSHFVGALGAMVANWLNMEVVHNV